MSIVSEILYPRVATRSLVQNHFFQKWKQTFLNKSAMLRVFLSDQIQKLLPRSCISLEASCNGARDRDGMLFLDPAHHHAEVARLDDDADADGFQHGLECIADFLTESFLGLETPRIHIDDARDFAEADDMFVRDVPDVHFSGEGKEVVLTERVALDVFHDDHTVGVGREQCTVDDFFEVLRVSRCQKRHGFAAALRRALQSGSARIFADGFDDVLEELIHTRILLERKRVRQFSPVVPHQWRTPPLWMLLKLTACCRFRFAQMNL